MAQNNAWLTVIITESAIEERIIRLIKSLGTKGYTVYRGLSGEGDRGVRSGLGGISVFGDNVRIETVVSSEEEADTVMREVIENYFNNFAGIAYASEVRVIRANKFLKQS